MATALQTLIDAYIKRNANQEITGPVLNGVLSAIADALGTPFIGDDGYWYTYDPETGQFVQTDTQAQGETGPVGVTEAAATIDANIGIPSVAVSLDGTRLDFSFHNLKGQKGDQGTAGITAAVVTVDGNVGTPSVDASISGTTLTLAFHNLKGETGPRGEQGIQGIQGPTGPAGAAAGFGTPTVSVGANQGTPSASVSASGPDTAKVFAFAFDGLKGETGPQGPQGPQGNPGSSQDYPFTLANNLTTDDSTVALTAAMGVQLESEVSQLSQELIEIQGGDEFTETVNLNSYSQNAFIINNQNKWEGNSTARSVFVPIPSDAKKLKVTMSGGNGMIAFLQNDTITSGATPAFSSSYPGRIQILDGNSQEWNIPLDANFIYVATKSTSGVDVRGFYDFVFTKYKSGLVYQDDVFKERIIEVQLERGAYNASGDFNIGYVTDDAYLRTPNFLKLPDDGVWGVRTDSDADRIVIRYFKEDYTFLSGVSATALEAQGFTEFTAPEGAAFVKMNFRNATTTDITPGKAYFRGKWLEEDPIYFNVRPSDNGYQTLEVRVNLYNPTACDGTTDAVQDTSAVGSDFGVLSIPTQYVNRGTPTRLIIYCHGAAVNYSTGAARFDSQDLDPAYWLSEGYAVMDIEGNPYNNTDEHFCTPQAYQCYKAAYEWVISHYNIRRDGVFLGGRSMGGLMTLDMITQERDIPIIAACPNVPCVIPTWYWNYMSADRRTFCANHFGFTNQPTWSGTSPMPTAEWNCLKANFDKLALASPFWRLLTDLPDKDTLFNGTNISKSSNDPTPLLAVYGNCRLRVKAPVKMFICRDDDVAIPEMNGDILAKIAKQSAQIFVVREFEDGGHHYDTQNSDLQVTITNSFGVSITTSVVYIEMLAWWREWEQRG